VDGVALSEREGGSGLGVAEGGASEGNVGACWPGEGPDGALDDEAADAVGDGAGKAADGPAADAAEGPTAVEGEAPGCGTDEGEEDVLAGGGEALASGWASPRASSTSVTAAAPARLSQEVDSKTRVTPSGSASCCLTFKLKR
jgi:hypothetical protein